MIDFLFVLFFGAMAVMGVFLACSVTAGIWRTVLRGDVQERCALALAATVIMVITVALNSR